MRPRISRTVPSRPLPVGNGAVLFADRAPPHDGIGIRIHICFNHPGTRLSPRASTTSHRGISRFLPRVCGRINNNFGKVLDKISRGSGLRSDHILFGEKVREICNPGISHSPQPVRDGMWGQVVGYPKRWGRLVASLLYQRSSILSQ